MDVAVIIPAFNAAPYLAQTLASVRDQTLSPRRVVVIDDGSTDDTAAIADSFGGVTVVRQPNRGVAVARNRGVREAGTEWVAFLDADDVWLPAKLERQCEALRAEGASCSLTALRLVDRDLRPLFDAGVGSVDTDVAALLFHGETIPQGTLSTMLVRTSLFDAAGGFDERLSISADWDLLLRLRYRTGFTYVPEPLVLYRRHGNNMSRNVELLERDTQRVLEKAFASTDLPPAARALESRCLGWNDLVLAGSYFWAGRPARALRFGARALRRDPRLIVRILKAPYRHVRRLARGALRPGSV